VGYLSTPSRIFEPNRSRLVFLLVAGAAFLVTEFGRYVYRPYVYSRGVSDFGLADSVGNLGGIIVQIFLGIGVLNATRKQSFRLAAFFSIGFVLYEFAQPLLPKGVFDWRDIVATAVGYSLSVTVLFIVWRRNDGDKPANGQSGASSGRIA